MKAKRAMVWASMASVLASLPVERAKSLICLGFIGYLMEATLQSERHLEATGGLHDNEGDILGQLRYPEGR